MMRNMSFEQFRDWQIFGELEPFDEERMDYRFGALMSLIANINRNSKKQRKPFTIEEAMPRFGDSAPKAKPKSDWRGMKALAMMMTAESRDKKPEVRRTKRVS